MKEKSLAMKFAESWANTEDGVYSSIELLEWIQECNRTIKVEIRKNALSDSDYWLYDSDKGIITNKTNSFFSICGLRQTTAGEILWEQPIIMQEEIGYLGIIGMEIDGVLHFLMQAKIEPGNINKVQVSPTIQATKSNFTRMHGGTNPPYLDYFLNAEKYFIVVDQLQSEQSSRFYKKRNRNIIILVDDAPKVLPSHRWMTLGQIKELMRYDNIVNMDTRTVLSCIPYSFMPIHEGEEIRAAKLFHDRCLYRSVFEQRKDNLVPLVYRNLNNYKMFNDVHSELIRLDQLKSWEMTDDEFVCLNKCDFKIIFCDIEIEGREVRKWTQPLFEASGIAIFGLIMYDDDGVKKFLVSGKPEVGCFDQIEIAPTVQLEASAVMNEKSSIDRFFFEWIGKYPESVRYDVLLSEEGGRFYHEQNRNIIVQVPNEFIQDLFLVAGGGYFGIDYWTLNILAQVNNCLNIQLRNLMSLLRAVKADA